MCRAFGGLFQQYCGLRTILRVHFVVSHLALQGGLVRNAICRPIIYTVGLQ